MSTISRASGFSATRVQHEQPPLDNPDALTARDSTMLNKLHRQFARNPQEEMRESIKNKKVIEDLVESLVRTPFRLKVKDKIEGMRRWAGKKRQFPIIIKPSYTKEKKVQKEREGVLLTEDVRTPLASSEQARVMDKRENDDDDDDEYNQLMLDEEIPELKDLKDKLQEMILKDDKDDEIDDYEIIRDYVAVHKKYLIVHFNYYLIYQHFHYPAEFALSEFSVQNGLGDTISGLIDIGDIPVGYASDVRERQEEIFVPHPSYNKDFNPYEHALRLIEEFCRPHFVPEEPILLFALKEHIPIVEDGLEWLMEASDRELDFKILPFSVLVQILANDSQQPPYRNPQMNNGKRTYHVAHECFLDPALHRGDHAYMPELACEHHAKEENQGGVPYCTLSFVKRCVFNASRVLLPLYAIKPLLHHHYPKILIKAQLPAKEEMGNLNFSTYDGSSDASSLYSDSMTDCSSRSSRTGHSRFGGSRRTNSTSSSIQSRSTKEKKGSDKTTESTTDVEEQQEEKPEDREYIVAAPWDPEEVLKYFEVQEESFGTGPCDVHDMRPKKERTESETADSDEERFSDTASIVSSSFSQK